MTTGLYAGSFDPLTNGHVWLIKQGAKLFDNLIVGIGTNPDKRTLFSETERTDFLVKTLAPLSNVTVVSFPALYTVDFAAAHNITHLLRGVRSAADLAAERTIQLMNDDIASIRHIVPPTNIFMMPPRELAELSSSMIKSLIGPKSAPFANWEPVVKEYVPPAVLEGLRLKYAI